MTIAITIDILDNIPTNIFALISTFLSIPSILKFGLTCKKISKILTNEFLWRQISNKEFGENQEKPNEFETWKQFVKEGNLQWQTNILNKRQYVLSKNNKLAERIVQSSSKTLLSKQIIIGKGEHEFTFLVNCKHPDCHSIGICETDYQDFKEYVCNSKYGKGVCGSGFIGYNNNKAHNYLSSDLRYGGKDKTETIHLLVDLEFKELTIWNEEKPKSIYCSSIDDLKLEKGLRIAVSQFFSGDTIEIKSYSRRNNKIQIKTSFEPSRTN